MNKKHIDYNKEIRNLIKLVIQTKYKEFFLNDSPNEATLQNKCSRLGQRNGLRKVN